MMSVTITCPECASAIDVLPKTLARQAECDICHHRVDVEFSTEHEEGILKTCPCCQRKDFYSQKDFNRKIGVLLFIVAAILSVFTYGISFIVLYLFDFILFKKLRKIAICYKCQTIFRGVKNLDEIPGFDHEMNDRIVYADHDFKGQPLAH